VQIDDFKTEHVADLLSSNEERHALPRRRLAFGDIFDINYVFRHISGPALRSRGRIPVDQIVDGRLQNLGDPDTESNHDQDNKSRSSDR